VTRVLILVSIVHVSTDAVPHAPPPPKSESLKHKQLKPKDDLFCSACEIFTEKLAIKLNEADPKSTIKIGHRMQPNSPGAGKYIKYARSETRIVEILDDLCASLEGFNAVSEDTDGRKKFVNTNGGGPINNIKMVGGELDQVRNVCYQILEEHDESITNFLYDNYAEDLQLRKKICRQMAKTCTYKRKKKADHWESPSNDSAPSNDSTPVHSEL